jgi:KUP system potassium uptake protein
MPQETFIDPDSIPNYGRKVTESVIPHQLSRMDVNLSKATLSPIVLTSPNAANGAQGNHQGGNTISWKGLLLSSLGCVGVIWGDLGTSPLYTLSSVFTDEFPRDDILGCLSLVLWSLFAVVTVKYISIVLKCAYNGEGGVFALVQVSLMGKVPSLTKIIGVTSIGTIGAAFLMSDGLITPALSVLSAVEGLSLSEESATVGITLGILIPLYFGQRFGSTTVGKVFGPINVLYFLSIGGIGLYNIIKYDYTALEAFNPKYAYMFLFTSSTFSGDKAFRALSSIVLCLTGAEEVWADLGHFGPSPIYFSWFTLVCPCLYLSYIGQCAYLLSNPDSYSNIFWDSIPTSIYYPVWVICTLATIVASQSAITGCYSMIGQGVSLGILPRLRIYNTDINHKAQIYIPSATLFLGIGTCAIVIGFKSSENLAGAYGIAVLITFVITDCLTVLALKKLKLKNWSLLGISMIMLPFLVIDGTYLSANFYDKITVGGWLPVTVGTLMTTLMLSWYFGRRATRAAYKKIDTDTSGGSNKIKTQQGLLDALNDKSIGFGPGTGLFLIPEFVEDEELPRAFLTLLKVTGSIPQRTIFLNINFDSDAPFVDASKRVVVRTITPGVYQADIKYGFAEPLSEIQVEQEIKQVLPNLGCLFNEPLKEGEWYFVYSENVHAANNRNKISKFFMNIYRAMLTVSAGAAEFFGIPEEKVIQLGGHLNI